MSDKDPGWWQSVFLHLSQNRLGWFTLCSAWLAAFWAGRLEGNSLARSAFGGVICALISLAIMYAMRAGGVRQDWVPFVGIVVGFIGAERIRDAILGAWDSRKKRIMRGKNNDHQQ